MEDSSRQPIILIVTLFKIKYLQPCCLVCVSELGPVIPMLLKQLASVTPLWREETPNGISCLGLRGPGVFFLPLEKRLWPLMKSLKGTQEFLSGSGHLSDS